MAVTLVYTTRDKIARRISQLGIDVLIDDDLDALNGAIEDATVEVNGYCLLQYSAEVLAVNDWVAMRATDIATKYLCERRNNPCPQAAQLRYEKAIADLEKVEAGKAIPEAAMAKSSAPVLSNQRARQWPFPHVVTEPSQSTGDPAGYVQNADPNDIDPMP